MNNLICMSNPKATILFAPYQQTPFSFHSDSPITFPANIHCTLTAPSELQINNKPSTYYECELVN